MNGKYTLKKNSDFRRLYSRGQSAATKYLVVYCRKNKTGENRLGYTVSAKLGHAVVRNKIRRRLREIYRLNSPAFLKGYDIVVVARSKSVTAEYASLNNAFMDACGKLGLLKEPEE